MDFLCRYIEHFTKHFFSVGKSCLLNIFFYVLCTFWFCLALCYAYEWCYVAAHTERLAYVNCDEACMLHITYQQPNIYSASKPNIFMIYLWFVYGAVQSWMCCYGICHFCHLNKHADFIVSYTANRWKCLFTSQNTLSSFYTAEIHAWFVKAALFMVIGRL